MATRVRGLKDTDDVLQEVSINMDEIDEEEVPFLDKPNDISKPVITTKKTGTSTTKAVMAVSFYWVTSLSLVFLNKIVMVGDVTHMDAPLFMSWTQFVITVLCCYIIGEMGKYIKIFSFFPPFEYKLNLAKKVMPLTFVFLGMIVFNNLCLKYVEVSFYQVWFHH